MKLLIDIGNTHTVAGFTSDGKDFSRQIRFRTDAAATPDEYRSQLIQLFKLQNVDLQKDWPKLRLAVISSVVPMLERTLMESLGQDQAFFVRWNTPCDFKLKLPHPEQLGADRLANVAGALSLFEPPFIIVDAGTATTFCLVDSQKNYIGGAIVPGLETSWKALQNRAAKLFSVELNRPKSWVGNTTETQLQSGVLGGYEAMIEGLTQRLIQDAPKEFKDAKWIATGGIMNLLKLDSSFHFVPDLTLMGLYRYGESHAYPGT